MKRVVIPILLLLMFSSAASATAMFDIRISGTGGPTKFNFDDFYGDNGFYEIYHGQILTFKFGVTPLDTPMNSDISGTVDMYIDSKYVTSIPIDKDGGGSFTFDTSGLSYTTTYINGPNPGINNFVTFYYNSTYYPAENTMEKVILNMFELNMPEFPSIALPITAILGVVVISNRRKKTV
jgi:hypothetical protein